MDKQWFLDRLAEGNKSLRGMARHLGIDVSAMSRMLSGSRRMKTEEANQIAVFLGVPITEVLVRAGAAVKENIAPANIMLAATIDERGIVQKLSDPKPLPQAVIERAQASISAEKSTNIVGAQIRATAGPLSVMDDAVVLYIGDAEGVDPAAIGLLSICRARDGEVFFAKIERARKTGEARVIGANGEAREVFLVAATPVLAMIP